MNILFIDNCTLKKDFYKKNKLNLILSKFGFCYLKLKGVFYININEEKLENKTNLKYFKKFLKYKIKSKKIYIAMSRYLEENSNLKKIFNTCFNNPTFVSIQNNLYNNDKKYIDDYLIKNKIQIKDVRVLLIVDELNKKEKIKLEEMLDKYKIVDIYMLNPSNIAKNYVCEINNRLGSVVELLDKIPNEYYNIFLVFSKKYKNSQNKCSFILDYNNSDLDVKSNTYLIFEENKKHYEKIFNQLGMDISRYEKTKLGKLYILASELILDI